MRVEAVSDGEDSSGTYVLQGIARYSKHDWHISQYMPNLDDCDIVYIHSGILFCEYSPPLMEAFNDRRDLKWASGLRGELNYKRWVIDWNPTTRVRDFIYKLNAISCSNNHYLQELQKFGFNAHLCPSGVDPTMFKAKPIPVEFTIGFVGNREHGEKNYPLFESLPFKNKLVAATDIEYEDMPDFYNRISALVCCSFTEGSPVPPKETACCGRPTVAFSVGDIPDWLPENLVVKDREEMIKMLKLMEGEPNFIEIYGTLCNIAVEKYNFLNVAPLYDVMLESCFK